MKVAAQYSHLNGLEFLIVHHGDLLVVGSVDAEACRTDLRGQGLV